MSKTFREREVQAMKDGETWGLCCTDSFGMVSNNSETNLGSLWMRSQGIDLPDICVIIQWRVRCSMCTLWQRFGRGARSPHNSAIAILFAESRYFDDEKEKARKAKARRANVRKRGAPSEPSLTRSHKVMIRTSRDGQPYAEVTSMEMSTSGYSLVSGSQPTVATSGKEVQPELEELPVVGNNSISRCQIRRAVYDRPVVGTKARSKVQKTNSIQELEPEMDDVVNAGSRAWKCYRAPSMIYFGNDNIGV
jgi:superfamily II DNA/RNA helicase